MGRAVAERIRTRLTAIDEPSEAIQTFILDLSRHVEASGFQGGSPITIVALEAPATSERLNTACREVYQLWQQAFQEKLTRSGYAEDQAERLATLIVASIEGAIILSRSGRSVAPLEHTAEELGRHLTYVGETQIA